MSEFLYLLTVFLVNKLADFSIIHFEQRITRKKNFKEKYKSAAKLHVTESVDTKQQLVSFLSSLLTCGSFSVNTGEEEEEK